MTVQITDEESHRRRYQYYVDIIEGVSSAKTFKTDYTGKCEIRIEYTNSITLGIRIYLIQNGSKTIQLDEQKSATFTSYQTNVYREFNVTEDLNRLE